MWENRIDCQVLRATDVSYQDDSSVSFRSDSSCKAKAHSRSGSWFFGVVYLTCAVTIGACDRECYAAKSLAYTPECHEEGGASRTPKDAC
jgi:hypothetical protein